MNKFKGILLDLDQTLCNSEDYALGSYGKGEENSSEKKVYEFLKDDLKVISWQRFKDVYFRSRAEIKLILKGRGASHSRYLYIQRTLENLNCRFRPDLIWKATNAYWKHTIDNMNLYPNVLEALKVIKQNHLKTAVITDLTADIQIRKLKKLQIEKYIDYLITSEEADADKPAVNQAKLALKKMKLGKEEVIIVGNNPKTDVALGKKATIKTVLFDYDLLYLSSEHNADFYIKDFSQLPEILAISVPKYSHAKLIVFDLIGTLTNEPHLVRNLLTKLIPIEYKELKKEYELYKVDEISRDEFWKRLDVKDSVSVEKTLMSKVILRKKVPVLLARLKSQGLKLSILSNIPKEWGRELIEKFQLKQYFDAVIFSGAHKTKKPDPGLYKILLQKFPRVDPEKVFYIDDNLKDLSAAKNFLMKTIWMKLEEQDADFIPDYVISNPTELSNLIETASV
ncbi:MAG: HAD family hydrolase [Patescibacteria group bacterium]|nr:HAD family hydrolase [Patescibacteria group bacterium]